ncbi:hypothetical protein JVX90_03650 [Gordonia sp. PDNC005]|uniref:hypothetical protein n=1 Tax=unclassified Gordonia (in: high G+C Gram-positive bacteria) TaxID=2657482 RepID=UPI001965B340|nr:hypothetical protein [Gordonia sp. PDNC005]QRY63339.1 hypothetical protein JVX90_03650 [Gordonia sp. PDNC005]
MSLHALAGAAAVVAADQEPRGPEFGKASPLGLLIIVLLLVATFLLIRSMNRQLRKLPESFDTEHPEADQKFDEGTDAAAADEAAPAEGAPDPSDAGPPPKDT